MFDIPLSDCGVLWHQVCVFVIDIYWNCIMFLGRSESIKWIRRRFSKRNSSSSTNVEHTPPKISKSDSELNENIRDLNEILIVTKSQSATITPEPINTFKSSATIHNSNEVMSTMPTNQTAPIAREEDAEEEIEEVIENQLKYKYMETNNVDRDEYGNGSGGGSEADGDVINEIAMRRSSSASTKPSRVRNYLKKCKDRWLAAGLHNQAQEHNHSGHDQKSTMSAVNEIDVSQDVKSITAPTSTTSNTSTTSTTMTTIATMTASVVMPSRLAVSTGNRSSSVGGAGESINRNSSANCALENLKEMEESDVNADDDDDDDDDVDDSYEDIDFGLSSTLCKAATAATIVTKQATRMSYNKSSTSTISAASTNVNTVCNSAQIQTRQEKIRLKILQQGHVHHAVVDDGKHADQLVVSPQLESHIAALIDSYLAYIYPIFTQTTRAVLIREARDVLVNIYRGCLTTFEQQFLRKFAEIAVILKERHRIGEALIWCQGWPLVTPIGEVILHLGGLDDDQVKSAEIYLCVKTAETDREPQLYAIWRTPIQRPLNSKNFEIAITKTTATPVAAAASAATVTSLEKKSNLNSCQLDFRDHTLYLSTLTLEMLTDDLPQLLQSLLIGVENSLERLSFNQLAQIPLNGDTNCTSQTTGNGSATITPVAAFSASSADEKTHHGAVLSGSRLPLPNSPKCALRRSELITKNKLHNNKYMLRRLTNRQDSMNSTSSGNSSASGLSTASSDSDSYAKSLLNTNNARHINSSSNTSNSNNNSIVNCHSQTTATITATTTTATTIPQNETKINGLNSPALPRFCLGNSFPHIDSDEENTEEKRNSLTDDQLESEIVPPNFITDLPEKLLLSGIYLPGTRDLKGNPIVTVDAESVLTAGLNCYEIATLLLYYSTIPECKHVSFGNAAQKLQALATTTVPTSSSSSSLSPPVLPLIPSNQSTSQYATAVTTTVNTVNTQSSIKTTLVTASATATCTSLNSGGNHSTNNNSMLQLQQQPEHSPVQHQQQQQQKIPFTILIAIEKAQHLCVIDLISQSLKLLTRYIAYCELLAICTDTNLLTASNRNVSADDNVAINTKIINGTNGCNGTSSNSSGTANLTDIPTSTDANGNHCHAGNKKSVAHTIKFISIDEVTTSVAPSQTPSGRLGGLHHHDAQKWRDFFIQFEPFYNQCTGAAHRLVAALNDIRCADLQGLPTRRQLYAQHRALNRALMDSELHNLRKRSSATMNQLQELAKSVNSNSNSNISNKTANSSGNSYVGSLKTTTNMCSSIYNRNKIMGIGGTTYSFNYQTNQNHSQISHNKSTVAATVIKSSFSVAATAAAAEAATSATSVQPTVTATLAQTQVHPTNPIIKSGISSNNLQTCSNNTTNTTNTNTTTSHVSINYANSSSNNSNSNSSNCNNNNNNVTTTTIDNVDIAVRLQKVTLLFNEIDRTAKRLEQLTERRREHLRELTRQRALEDEINEVTAWISSDGSESLLRFINLELDFDTPMKELEQEFEKYYFISMKYLAKGRDLHLAASSMESLQESSFNLKKALDSFAEKLEITRERIEGATRLHHLIHLHMLDDNMQHEMEHLAIQYGVKRLLEKYIERENEIKSKPKPESLNLHMNQNSMQKTITQLLTSTPEPQKLRTLSQRASYGAVLYESPTCQCWRDSRNLYEMDELLDNDEEEGRSKIADSGVGECQRCEGNPKLTRVCSCQSLNEETENLYEKHDELDDECFEQPSKHYINVHSPWEANKHLQCYGSTFELPALEELSCLDQKIQKTLLLIMREMIGTERDYVRSLYYVIENYIDELLRDDIPQSLRGQRNVIFGNIEKIFEFHNNHFLAELERYEHSPLKVGAAFLQMESKFYLYALYNKNKPKSDTLMSEYGTAFFKTKQMELNDKMDLASYLLKPVQRMGKYALLLQHLVKACNTVEGPALQEIAGDVEELQKAEEMVKFQLRHGNDLLAMDSLRDCDVNVKEQGRLLRQNEFLVWQGKGGKKTLRQIFLFEELVLFSKARRFPDHKNLDIYIYKNSIKTSDIGLTAHVGDSPTKFEIWFRKRKPEDTFTLQCMSEDIKNAWTEEISKLLWQQAKRNREIRLAEMSSMGIGSKPCLDIRPSNNQINDRSITISQLGKAPKLRHSFVGLHTDQIKNSRRPNSLISESSLSSGTSSSSLNKSSSSSSSSSAAHHNSNHNQPRANQQQQQQLLYSHHPIQALELISECQTLPLDNGTDSCNRPQQLMTNTLSSGFSSQSGGVGTMTSRQFHRNHHKRSTTIVSQLSMESGIISDICMTPDQDNNDVLTTWPSHPTDGIVSPTTGCQKHLLKCHSSNTLSKKLEQQQQQQLHLHHHHHQQHQHHYHTHQHYKELKSEEIENHSS